MLYLKEKGKIIKRKTCWVPNPAFSVKRTPVAMDRMLILGCLCFRDGLAELFSADHVITLVFAMMDRILILGCSCFIMGEVLLVAT